MACDIDNPGVAEVTKFSNIAWVEINFLGNRFRVLRDSLEDKNKLRKQGVLLGAYHLSE